MSGKIKRAGAVTIGCRLNQADTALMFSRLKESGYEIADVDGGGDFDLIVVNTCAVTATAVKKSRQSVRRQRKLHPGAVIVVSGCSSELERDMWEGEEGVDIVIGNEDKKNLASILRDRAMGSPPRPPAATGDIFFEGAGGVFPFRHRAFIKVQEGCDSFCSYCIVPHARGRERSRDWEEVRAEFLAQVRSGFKEIVVTGVNTSAYSHKGRGLADLLEELASCEGDFRIRVSSTEPHKENARLLRVMAAAGGKICRFIHLPIQHGSDEVLRLMNRRYTVSEFEEFVAMARELSPLVHIGTDIIAGFPGETDELFEKSFDTMARIGFANTHIFTYSPRKGTPACDFPGRPPAKVVTGRFKRLEELSRESAADYARRNLGETLRALIEEEGPDGVCEGWSDNYLRVRFDGRGKGQNEFADVTPSRLDEASMILE